MKANHPLVIKSLRRMRRAYLLTAFITLPFGVFATCAPLWSSEGRGLTIANHYSVKKLGNGLRIKTCRSSCYDNRIIIIPFCGKKWNSGEIKHS